MTGRDPGSESALQLDEAELRRFYERGYSLAPEEAERYARWRALGARGKAEHVIALCARAGLAPSSTLEVGCGDGALLSELHRRGFGGRLEGLEISAAAVTLADSREEIASVQRYDGTHIPAREGAYALGVISHVLEHVGDPPALLAEAARVCAAVVIEVPLEANLSARRASRREHSGEVGHLQRLDRAGARRIVASAGLRTAGEIEDALGLEVQMFFADSVGARHRARARWGVRAGVHGLAPPLARRLFTVHYAALCLPQDA